MLTPQEKTFPRFVSYLCQSDAFTNRVTAESQGITFPAISETKLGLFEVGVPPLSEQIAIVRYLDHADGITRRYIRFKQQLVALLEEHKQVTINQAATGQIDVQTAKPYMAYKLSGVEWLPEVPQSWEPRRLKQCAHTISKGTTPSTEGRKVLGVGPVRFIKAENITSMGIADHPSHFVDEETNKVLRRSQLLEGDVLFVIAGATLGKTSVVDQDLLPANTNQAVAFIRPHTRVLSKYLAFFLQSPRVQEATWLSAVQAAQPNLAMGDLGGFLLPLPSLSEQSAIVEFVESKTASLDTAIAHARREIALLQEHCDRLITDVVTGKVDVRAAASEMPEVNLVDRRNNNAEVCVDADIDRPDNMAELVEE